MRFNSMILLLITGASFYSCAKKEKSEILSEHRVDSEWVEMNSFHMIMSEAFHPYLDSANLEPMKRLADAISLEAEKWSSTTLPDRVNNDIMKEQLIQLNNNTQALSEMVSSGASDDDISASLKGLHNSFHMIMKAWKEGGQKDQH